MSRLLRYWQESAVAVNSSLKYCIMGFNPKSIAAMLENIVYFELRRRLPEESDQEVANLLEFSNSPISVIEKNYSTSVCLYTLNNNLMNSDLMTLFSAFEQ